MASIVYCLQRNESGLEFERDLIDIDTAGYLVDMSLVFVERCSVSVAAASRPVFQRAMRRMMLGDCLITTKLWSFGNSISDVISTFELLLNRDIQVICLAYGKQDLCAPQNYGFLHALRLANDLEHKARQDRGREASQVKKDDGIVQGRPLSLSHDQRQRALESLALGSTVADVARTFETSRQTIMRLRDASKRR